MEEPVPASASALMSAAARAAHLLVDTPPHLICDDLALRLCRSLPTSPLDYQLAHRDEPVLAAARFSACVRARFAADTLGHVEPRQGVLLGAGLDHPVGDTAGVQWWTVDLPDVLAWRADLYERAGLTDRCCPSQADLTADDLVHALVVAGLDTSRPVMVVWLGGTMYLPDEAVQHVFAQCADLAAGSVLVADFVTPPADRDQAGQAYADALATAVGGHEPWRCQVSAQNLGDWLGESSWQVSRTAAEADAVPAGFWDRRDALKPMRLVQLVEANIPV
ncbi:MAG: SAM-dependent methyltransferase [Micrococcales bacterium]|nr:SAM-dependent methyltransferase [Micrococcales bacterium]